MGVHGHRPSHLVLTGFVAGHDHSRGRRLVARSSGPSAHRWYRWHYHGSQDWASRLGKERLRGQQRVTVPRFPTLSSCKPQECWVSWLRSLSLASSMDLEGAPIRLGVAKAQHPQTHGQIFLPHAALRFPGLAHRRHLDAHYHHQGPRGKLFTQYSQEHELHPHCQDLIFLLHSSTKKDTVV